jgi:pimeloyl-ACP methyl ester carboxylesterase
MAAAVPRGQGPPGLRCRRTGVRRASRQRQQQAAHIAAAASVSSAAVVLPDQTPLEVLSALPPSPSSSSTPRPPLLFVHGSGHAAWCWAEHFLPWFADRGWGAHAVSLRGRGGSGPPPPGAKAGGTLASHAADLAAVIRAGYGQQEGGSGALPPPVLIGHSFGGLIAQRCAADPTFPPLSGLALAASVPPSGNGPMIARIAKARGLWSSAVLTWDFIAKTYRRDPAAARRLFFSDGMPDAEVERLRSRLADQDGPTPVVDVRALASELPVPPPARPVPGFVLGGGADRIVDVAGLEEAADAIAAGAPATVLPGLAHDLMLDVGWEAAAGALAGWLEAEVL